MAVDNSFWVASPQFVSWIPSSLRTFSIGPKRIGYQFVPRPVVASVWGHPVRSPRISHGNHVVRTRGGRGRAQEKRRSQKCGRYQADEVMRVPYDSPLGFHWHILLMHVISKLTTMRLGRSSQRCSFILFFVQLYDKCPSIPLAHICMRARDRLLFRSKSGPW